LSSFPPCAATRQQHGLCTTLKDPTMTPAGFSLVIIIVITINFEAFTSSMKKKHDHPP
jgi:hypothetical protein